MGHMKTHPLIFALAAILLWSSLATFGALTQRLPPFQVTAIGLGIGSLLSLHQLPSWRVSLPVWLTGIAGIFGYHALLFSAFRLAPALEANLLNYLWPLLIVLLSPVFRLGKLSLAHILASIAGFSGAILIVTQGKLQLPQHFPIGYLFAVMAALCWACYSLLTRKLPPFPTAAVGGFCLASAVLATLCHLATETTITPTLHEWLALMAMGIGPLGLAFFCWDFAMKTGDPRQVGTLSYLTPLLSTLLLALTGRGQLTSTSAIAAALILGGALLGSIAGKRG